MTLTWPTTARRHAATVKNPSAMAGLIVATTIMTTGKLTGEILIICPIIKDKDSQ